MGSLSLLQGIFPTQGLNPGLPHCRRILYQLSHKGSPSAPESESEVTQSCLTLCDLVDCSLPGSSVHEIFQARVLEWVAILEWVAYPFSSRFSQPRNPTGISCIAGGFFTNWAIREALNIWKQLENYDIASDTRGNLLPSRELILDIVQLGRMIEKHKGFIFLVELALLSKVGSCGNSFKFIDAVHKVQQKFNPKLISKQTFLYWFITKSDR